MIDTQVDILATHLLAKVRDRYDAGERTIQLRISPERYGLCGQATQLLRERVQTAIPETIVTAMCWAGPERCGVIEVRFG